MPARRYSPAAAKRANWRLDDGRAIRSGIAQLIAGSAAASVLEPARLFAANAFLRVGVKRAYDAAMRLFLTAVAVVIAVIFVLKVVAAVSALVLAFVPAAVALLSGLAVGYRLGTRRERDRLQARTASRLPR